MTYNHLSDLSARLTCAHRIKESFIDFGKKKAPISRRIKNWWWFESLFCGRSNVEADQMEGIFKPFYALASR
jgi:hypothetical protein